jgi:diguanylate cyclase (GGDEF)-like protein
MSDGLKVLFIEDNLGDSRLIQELLSESRHIPIEFHRADSLASGLAYLSKGGMDIVLLDLSLPDSQGLETLARVREHVPGMPVIVLTGLDDEKLGVEAVQAGAQDYLVKGQINSSLLIRAVRYAIERKRFEQRLEYLATHDELTGLPNRQLFRDLLEHALERAKREHWPGNDHGITSVMLLDLDDFKDVNDSLGHAQGDRLLCLVADRLQSCMRKSDIAARMGGDEFTIISEGITSPEASATIARKILSTISKPFTLDGKKLRVTASIGISLFPFDSDDPEILLKYADMAMYRAKEKRNCFWFHDPPTGE